MVLVGLHHCVPLLKVPVCNTPICVPFAKHDDKQCVHPIWGIAFQVDQVNQGSQYGNMAKQRKSAFEEHSGTEGVAS